MQDRETPLSCIVKKYGTNIETSDLDIRGVAKGEYLYGN
jgi:predicted nucleotidyltransferase